MPQQTVLACPMHRVPRSIGCRSIKVGQSRACNEAAFINFYIQSGRGKYATIFWQGKVNHSAQSRILSACSSVFLALLSNISSDLPLSHHIVANNICLLIYILHGILEIDLTCLRLCVIVLLKRPLHDEFSMKYTRFGLIR